MIVTTFIFHPVPFFTDYKITSFKYLPYSEILFFLIGIFWLFYIDLNIIKDKIGRSFFLLLLIFFIGLFWSEDTANAIVIFKTNMYLFIVPILLTVFDKKNIRLMLIFLLSCSVISAISTIFFYITLYSESFELKLNTISPFINYMYYGPILAISLVYFLVNIKLQDKKYLLIIKILSIIILFISISIICNRSSLIGLFTAISFYIWIDKNSLSKMKRFFLILISIFLVITFISKINSNCGIKFLDLEKNFQKEIKGKRIGTSVGCRIYYIEASINLIKENIFIGVGTGDNLIAMRKLYGEDGYKDLVSKPCPLGQHNQIFYFDNHNMYLTMIMLFGPIGLWIFIYLFYTIFKVGSKIKSYELKLSVIITAISAIPITLFYTSSNFVLFFSLYIGIVYVYKKEKIDNEVS